MTAIIKDILTSSESVFDTKYSTYVQAVIFPYTDIQLKEDNYYLADFLSDEQYSAGMLTQSQDSLRSMAKNQQIRMSDFN